MTSFEPQDAPSSPRAPLSTALLQGLPIGLAATVAMFLLAYLVRLPGVEAPGWVAGLLAAAALGGGGFSAGRITGIGSGALSGAAAGLVASAASLIAVASALVDAANEGGPPLTLAVPGWLAFSTALGAVAGALGHALAPRAATSERPDSAAELALLAKVACAAVVGLLVLGGAVTSTEQGLAVPDWPTSFGANMFLLPLSRMTGGVYLEHAHRLYGALVGLITLTLTVWTVLADRRTSVRILAALALALVIGQGVMGGLRVTQSSDLLAAAHGLLAQLFFAFMCLFAATLSGAWRKDTTLDVDDRTRTLDRRLTLAAWITLFVQIALGVVARHFDANVHGIVTHAAFSVAALTLILAAAFRARKSLGGDAPLIHRLATASLHTVGAQMLLGLLTLWQVLTHRQTDPLAETLLATAHQVVGALLFGQVTLLALWTWRLTRRAPLSSR